MVSVVVNYCSNELAYIDAMLTQLSIFSDDVVVSYGSHLYDGRPENREHIEQCRRKYPNVAFVESEIDVSIDLSKQRGVKIRPKAYWNNLARMTGVDALKKNGWVFLLDADEIPEGKEVKVWLERRLPFLKENECYKLDNYWYFKSPTLRAMQLEDSILLIHRKHLNEQTIFGDDERDYTITASGCVLRRHVRGLNGQVLWHHYSFVRSREGLIHKLKNWSHSTEEAFAKLDVEKYVDEALSRSDGEVYDFVHGYKYLTVENRFNIAV